jgi:hypothetical protein
MFLHGNVPAIKFVSILDFTLLRSAFLMLSDAAMLGDAPFARSHLVWHSTFSIMLLDLMAARIAGSTTRLRRQESREEQCYLAS